MHLLRIPVSSLFLAAMLLAGCGRDADVGNGGGPSRAGAEDGVVARTPIPPEVQEFFDTKVALPVELLDDLEAGRISQEEVDQRIAAGEFPKFFEFKTPADLPSDLEWEDGMDLPEIGSPEAKKGGTLYEYVQDFPRTLRVVGPDAGSTFRPYLVDHMALSLGRRHPNDTTIDELGYRCFAELAKEWSIDPETATCYVRLRPEARWSDGVPITVDDYFYAIYFFTSEHIQDPWYPNFYNRHLRNFVKYDDYTFSFRLSEPKPDMRVRMLSLHPMPMHFYGVLDENYVDKFQWKFQPTTGPYVIREEDISKGRYIRLTRNPDWWAKDLKFQRYRYNFDVIHISVIRDHEKAIEAFKKGELDIMPLTISQWWHEKVPDNDPLVRNGYIHKYTYFNDIPRPSFAIWMNQAVAPTNNRDIRLGIQYAMNWERVIQEYHRGDYVRMRTNSDGFGEFTHPDLRARPFSVEKALEHFAAAGYTQRNARGILVNDRGEELKVTLTTPWQSAAEELTILQQEARRCGLDLNLEILDLTAGYKKIDEKKHQLAFAAFNTAPEMYPRYWEFYHSYHAYDRAFLPDGSPNPERKPKPNTNNIQSFADPEMDRLIDRYRASTDAQEMIKLAHRIQEVVHEAGSFNPSYVRPFIRVGSWRWIHWPEDFGVRILTDYREYNLAWMDEEEKQETRRAMSRGETFEPVIRYFTKYDVYGKMGERAE